MRLTILVQFTLLCGISSIVGDTANACRVAIDIGHSVQKPGAMSARGISEFHYNRQLAHRLHRTLQRQGIPSFLINEAGTPMALTQRTQYAQQQHAHLFLSIHHDSVQPHYLKRWFYQGRWQRYSDQFRGYSLFYSGLHRHSEASRQFATALGEALRTSGFAPSHHHAEPIAGENRPLINKQLGIYQFDALVVLRTATMPAVLLEAGIIVNRNEETQLASATFQQQQVAALHQGIVKMCQLLRQL